MHSQVQIKCWLLKADADLRQGGERGCLAPALVPDPSYRSICSRVLGARPCKCNPIGEVPVAPDCPNFDAADKCKFAVGDPRGDFPRRLFAIVCGSVGGLLFQTKGACRTSVEGKGRRRLICNRAAGNLRG